MDSLNKEVVYKDLKLNSISDSGPMIYKWPLSNPQELIENIKFVSEEVNAITTVLEDEFQNINELDTNDYELMKNLCEKYNKSIDSVKGLVSREERKKFPFHTNREGKKSIFSGSFVEVIDLPH